MNLRTSSPIWLLPVAALGLGLGLPACWDAPRVGARTDVSACVDASATSLDELWTEYFSPAAATGCAAAACHGGAAGGFSFTTELGMWQAAVGQPSLGNPGMMRVAPGDPLNSSLYLNLLESRMPLGGPYLDAAGVEAVRGWICSGASQPGNPVPSIAWISPATVAAGSAPFALTVHGAGFVAGSVVNVDGAPRTTVFQSGTDLSADVLAGDVIAVGTLTVTVSSPAPGGGTSGGATLTISASEPENPAPSISSISPSTAVAGPGGLSLTVYGAGFVPGSTVAIDGSARTTAYQSSTELTADLLAGDVAEVGTHTITVSTPAPGGGTSGGATLSVEHPAPAIFSLSPSTVAAGPGGLSLTVYGAGFVPSSSVSIDGSPRATVYQGGSELTADLLAGDLAEVGGRTITVSNPAPGGGTSGGATLTVTSLPGISSLSPCGTVAGAPSFSLTIDGFNFASGASVTFDGTAVAVTFVDPTRLTASIPASLVAAAPASRLVAVVVTNPGTGPSDPARFGMASQLSTLSANVQPIFDARCTSCHKTGGGSAPMSLEAASSYASLVGAASTGCSPARRVLACGPLRSQSVLVDKILATSAEPACSGGRMPQSGLSAGEQDLIVDWVAQGAPP